MDVTDHHQGSDLAPWFGTPERIAAAILDGNLPMMDRAAELVMEASLE